METGNTALDDEAPLTDDDAIFKSLTHQIRRRVENPMPPARENPNTPARENPMPWILEGIDIGYSVDHVTGASIDRIQLLIGGEVVFVVYNHGTCRYNVPGYSSDTNLYMAVQGGT
ncbi:MAG TPA: hypothetical protein VKM55_27790 [Candidatus Lokiarchaeia archaeon]|nr:hypothetical protein [Candidatus Lokiarchaeia archaeon]